VATPFHVSAIETAAVNPYESPQYGASGTETKRGEQPKDFNRWRVYLAVHLLIVLATFVATMTDTGYWTPVDLGGTVPGHFLGMCLFVAVMAGLFLVVYVSPVIILVLFFRAIKRREPGYAVAGVAELLLAGAHLFIAMPMCQ
jgi:hypothetical protein